MEQSIRGVKRGESCREVGGDFWQRNSGRREYLARINGLPFFDSRVILPAFFRRMLCRSTCKLGRLRYPDSEIYRIIRVKILDFLDDYSFSDLYFCSAEVLL
jgi:hypothetical protein